MLYFSYIWWNLNPYLILKWIDVSLISRYIESIFNFGYFFFQSQGRSEIMSTLEKVIKGLGSAGNSTYKDVYKATKQCMTDRSMVVRFAAAKVSLDTRVELP